MTPLKFTLQLLLLGVLLVSPAYSQQNPCEIIKKTVPRGSYKLDVEPLYYRPGEIYTVSITGINNSTSVILQALSPKSNSDGLWESENHLVNCGTAESLVQQNVSGSNTRTFWTSPRNTNVASAEIRAFVTFVNGTTLLQTWNLEKEMATASTPGTTPPSRFHSPTLRSNVTNVHTHLNTTVAHHNFASSHQGTKDPHSSVSVAQASSFLLALMQFFSVFLGYKLLS